MGMPGGHREADLLLAANATTTAAALVIIFMILLSVAKRPAGGVLGACCTLGFLLPYHGDDLQHAHWMDRPTQVVLVLCVLLLLALLLCAAPQHRNAMDKARRHVSFTLAAALIFFGLVALQLPLDEPLSTRLPEDLASYVPAARPGTWSGQEEETMPFVLMGLAAFCACAAALVTDCWGRCAPAPPDAAAKPAAPPPAPPKKGLSFNAKAWPFRNGGSTVVPAEKKVPERPEDIPLVEILKSMLTCASPRSPGKNNEKPTPREAKPKPKPAAMV